MKVVWVRNIGSISLSLLLIASIIVIIANSTAEAAEQAPASTATSGIASEVVAASSSNRFVVWSDNSPGNYEIFFRRSADSGATWKPTVNLSNNPGRSNDEQIAVVGSNVYVVWAQANVQGNLVNIFFRHSPDFGVTWKPFVKITSSETIQFIDPQIATSANNVYIVWQGGDAYFRGSSDNGATWQSIVNLSDDLSAGNAQLAAVESNVFVVWENGAIGRGDIMSRRSTDNGNTWESTFNVSDNPLESTEAKIAASGSRVYVAWAQEMMLGSTSHDIFFRRSTDGGATWKPVRNLSNNDGQSFDQEVAASGSNVYVVWIDETPGNHEILFKRSTDNGATWKSTVNLSNNAAPSLQPIIAASGSSVYVVWSNRVPGNWELYFRASTDNGATWKPFVNLSNNPGVSGNPGNGAFVTGTGIAVSGSHVHVAWQDSTGGDYDILSRRSTDNGATWKSVKNLSNNGGDSSDPQIAM